MRHARDDYQKTLTSIRKFFMSDVVLTASIRWTFILGVIFLTVGRHL